MKRSPQIVQTLNELLVGELTAVNQYFVVAKLHRQRGYARLASKLYKESLEEMKHADKLIERILFLEGLPNVQKLEKVRITESVPEQLRADLDLERLSVERLNHGIALAREAGDNGTAELLAEILQPAESHVDWIRTQLALIGELGEEHYLAQQVKDD